MSRGLLYSFIAAAALANIAVFIWQDAARKAVVSPSKGRLPELVLLSELDDDPSPSPGQSDGETDAESSIPAEGDRREFPSTAVTGVVDQPADAGVDGSGEDAGFQRGAEAIAAAAQRCWLAGPVVGERLAVELAASFDAEGVTMDLVLETVEAEPEYWVYLPTSGVRADMRRLSRELREAGVDSFSINEGTLAGSLSLGLFRSSKRAEAMQSRLQEQGYSAEIYPRSRVRDEAWIALDDSERTALEWPDIEGPLPGYAGMTIRERPCPEPRD